MESNIYVLRLKNRNDKECLISIPTDASKIDEALTFIGCTANCNAEEYSISIKLIDFSNCISHEYPLWLFWEIQEELEHNKYNDIYKLNDACIKFFSATSLDKLKILALCELGTSLTQAVEIDSKYSFVCDAVNFDKLGSHWIYSDSNYGLSYSISHLVEPAEYAKTIIKKHNIKGAFTTYGWIQAAQKNSDPVFCKSIEQQENELADLYLKRRGYVLDMPF